jgi:4-amino-4-deoxy-L-arabinose transferase-like glycosyltransferase
MKRRWEALRLRLGLAWLGLAWLGLAWLGLAKKNSLTDRGWVQIFVEFGQKRHNLANVTVGSCIDHPPIGGYFKIFVALNECPASQAAQPNGPKINNQ